MNDLQRGLLALIRSAVTGKEEALPAGFTLEQARDLIIQHKIEGLAYEGAVRCGISKQEPVMKELFKRYYQQIMLSQKQNAAIEKVQRAFDENGIDYLPVKGCKIQRFYPGLGTRTMGDADILIRMEQYERIKPLVSALGFEEAGEYFHEMSWQSEDLHLELHRSLVPSYHVLEYAYFEQAWELAVREEGCRYALDREMDYLFLFAHLAKHYRAGGVGIRLVLDLWVYERQYPNMDADRIRQGLEALRFREFYDNTRKLMQAWFADGPVDEMVSHMTDYIFSSGVWGTMENHKAAETLLRGRQAGSAKKAKFRKTVSAIFPPLRLMKRHYKVLGKAPWLLPVMWPVRWVSAVLFRRDNISSYGKSIKDFEGEKTASFEQSLQYVGLDFHV